MRLTHFDSDAFRCDIWQQRPALIRNPWDGWVNPLEPDELAGLACEDEVEARLVLQAQAGWKTEHGPFDPARFGQLGQAPWTLLVQAVDHLVPDVAALIEAFRFVPNWRIDDVMVSYATDGGGVGPHFDQYDVFLIQGLGRRRWQVGARCDHTTPLLPHDDLRLLAEFTPTEEWVLEPGDILYVPPGVAHNGVALGDDCMTYSIGFRAPSRSELIAHWADQVLGGLADEDRYADPGLAEQDNPGEITAEALGRLQALIAEKLLDRAGFARWFGEYNTAPKYPDRDWSPEAPIDAEDLGAQLAAGAVLERNPASRFAFVEEGQGTVLFVDGDSWDCATDVAILARRLCAETVIAPGAGLSDAAVDLLADLLNEGCLAFVED